MEGIDPALPQRPDAEPVEEGENRPVEGRDIRRGFHHFTLYERGKLREISSVHFSERVIHKSLSVNALVPAIAPSFIRNNTANTKGAEQMTQLSG
ncbi:MAG: hypothetical protein ACLUW6_02365 [Coriobacteriaceae bacterium]